MVKRNRIYIIIFLLCVVILGLHMLRFGLSISDTEHEDWSCFGDYVSGTIGICLTFITVYLLIKQSNDRQAEIEKAKKERIDEKNIDLLQMMLSMNRSVVDSIKIENDATGPDIEGPEALKGLYEKYLLKEMEKIYSQNFHRNPLSFERFFSEDACLKNYLTDIASKNNIKCTGNCTNEEITNILSQTEITDKLFAFGDPGTPFNNFIRCFSKYKQPQEVFPLLCSAYESFYQKKGYLVARYFRNHYYLLNWIENKITESNDQDNFAYFARSMMSSYEVVLLYYNYHSSYTSQKYNRLIKKYDLFHDLECTDFVHDSFFMNCKYEYDNNCDT